MDREDWNARYDTDELIWRAEPNRFLPPEVAGLAPGRALDVACGEGRNAVWLASQGWTVTGVDFADVALAKGARLAAEQGVAVTWDAADLLDWHPDPGAFDLVVVFYLQLPAEPLAAVLGAAVGGLAPGGVLVAVGHDRRNLDGGYGGPRDPAVLATDGEVAEVLVGLGLTVERAEVVHRPVQTDDGERVALDYLVRAVRGGPAGGHG